MAAKTKKASGLGKGLDSIFLENDIDDVEREERKQLIRLSMIEPKAGQPRKNFDTEALA